MKRRNALFVALFCVFAFGGCASYRPAAISELAPREQVRMRLAPQELGELVAFADANGLVSGRFVQLEGDTAHLLLTAPGSQRRALLHRASILEIERREGNPGKSLLFSAAVVGGIGVAAWLGFEEGRQAPGGPGDEDGDEAFAPVLRLRIPIGR